MGQILGRCVGLISGNEWKSVRGVVEHPFIRSSAADLVPLVQQHVETHVNELWQSGQLSKGLLDPVEDLKMLPFWVVAEIFYGQLSTGMIHELKELAPQHEELFKYVIRGGLSRFSWSRFLPTKANTSLAAFQKRWKAFNDDAYQRAVRIQNSAPIIQMYEAVQQVRLTRDELYQTLDESLYANLDVAIGGLSWNLVFLAAYKGQQDLLLDEINSIDEDGFRRYILSSSSLLAACISESSRLKPVAAFSIPQSTPSARIIDGYEIPAGTNFVVDAYGLNIRNEYWGNDSTVYRPQRFLEKADVELRYHFWRFGFGPRQCMGKHVADLITRALLIHILTRYELDLVEAGSEWGRNQESWITHPKMQLKCVPRTSLSRNAGRDS
jgi:cytochrome P450